MEASFPKSHGLFKVTEKEYFERADLPFRLVMTDSCEGYHKHPVHTHEFTELTIVTDGSALHRTVHRNYPLKVGDVFLISKGQAHGYEQIDNLLLINIMFNERRLPLPLWDFGLTSLADILFHSSGEPKTLMTLEPAALAEVQRIAVEIVQEYNQRQKCFRFKIMALFMQLLVELARNYIPSKPKDANTAGNFYAIPDALEFLEKNYNRDMNFTQLARRFSMSSRNFFRVFKKSTGTTPLQYLIKIRLQYATKLLKETPLSMDELALRSGFRDRQHMYYYFRKFLGKSPREFRREST